jgi:hypothetical protein
LFSKRFPEHPKAKDMNKPAPPPQVPDLIDDCVRKIADIMQGKEIGITPANLSLCLGMLISIDRNDRDVKSAFAKQVSQLPTETLEQARDHIKIPKELQSLYNAKDPK